MRITLLKHPQQELPAPRHLAGEKTCAACLCPPNLAGANEHKGLRAVYGDTPKRRSGSCCWGRRDAACAAGRERMLAAAMLVQRYPDQPAVAQDSYTMCQSRWPLGLGCGLKLNPSCVPFEVFGVC